MNEDAISSLSMIFKGVSNNFRKSVVIATDLLIIVCFYFGDEIIYLISGPSRCDLQSCHAAILIYTSQRGFIMTRKIYFVDATGADDNEFETFVLCFVCMNFAAFEASFN